jgi:hypothetical protein
LHQVYQQDDENHPDRLYTPLVTPIAGRRLRLLGKGLLSRPSSDSATVEVGEPQVNIIVEYAIMLMNQLLAERAAGTQKDRYERQQGRWREKVEAHLRRFRTGSMAAQGGNWWHVEEDATSKYLILPQERM